MTLADALLGVPVPESSGARTSARLEYQRHWALIEILSRYAAGTDYLLLLEYHDDIVVLDSVASPTLIEFYQIKTKRGKPWRLPELLSRKDSNSSEKKPSILGKLFAHRIDFATFGPTLGFVTNAEFDFVIDNEKASHKADTLQEKSRKKIDDAIGDELPKLRPVPLNALSFVRSPMGIDGQESYVKGLLVDFLDLHVGDSGASSVNAWYRTLSSELLRKNNVSPAMVKDFSELVVLKGFGRKDLERNLALVKSMGQARDSWTIVQGILISEKFSSAELVQIHRHWNEVRSLKLDASNLVFAELYQVLKEEVSSLDVTKITFTETVQFVLSKIQARYGGSYSIPFLKAVILWVRCDDPR